MSGPRQPRWYDDNEPFIGTPIGIAANEILTARLGGPWLGFAATLAACAVVYYGPKAPDHKFVQRKLAGAAAVGASLSFGLKMLQSANEQAKLLY